ncbi:MAG: class I SAM-dependent methyltransferase [Candidatus Tritonobacter lacicola]|nr:class I SAM-dependent methyltransferase [Candidatus Tritonobacter lacicola]
MKNWDLIYQARGIFQKEPSRRVLRAIDSFKQYGLTRVLDLGCGTGRHTTHLVDAGFEVCGCDSSEEALAIAGNLIEEAAFKRCDMTSLPYQDEYFDGIICNHVIQHGTMAEVGQAVSEIRRVMKQGGRLLLVVVSTEHPKYFTGREIEPNTRINTDAVDGEIPHHFFTEEELLSLFADFEISKLDHSKGPSELDPGKESAAWELHAGKPE